MTRIYTTTFAATGDKETLAATDPGTGKVSLPSGWTPDYEKLDTDPSYRPVGRKEMNGVINEVTAAVGELQQYGFAPWQALTGGWPLNARVVSGGIVYKSTAAANTAVPPAAPWIVDQATPIAIKDPVRFTTTANITLSGLGTQAGGDWAGALTANDRVLVQKQSTGADNGWYVAAAGAWVRADDANTTGQVVAGVLCVVSEGSTLADSLWMLTTDGAITIGTTSLTFVRKDVPPGSLTSIGYQKLPGGLIIQWGGVITSAATPGSAAVTFPIAFPTLCAIVNTTRTDAATSSANTVSNASGITTSGFTAWSSTGSGTVSWIAVGY